MEPEYSLPVHKNPPPVPILSQINPAHTHIAFLEKSIYYYSPSRRRWYSGSVLAIGPKISELKPDWGQWTFKDDKIPWHDFFRRGNKAVGFMSKDFTSC
jgi:hypothetical protein